MLRGVLERDVLLKAMRIVLGENNRGGMVWLGRL